MTKDKYPKAPNLKIRITPEHIAKAIRASSSHCMISDAITKSTPWAKNVSTDMQAVRITDTRRNLRYIYFTPPLACLALIDFDEGKHTTLTDDGFDLKLTGTRAQVITSQEREAHSKQVKASQKKHRLPKKSRLNQSDFKKPPTKPVMVGSRSTELRKVGGKEPPQGSNIVRNRKWGMKVLRVGRPQIPGTT